jgi:hypothetical protein
MEFKWEILLEEGIVHNDNRGKGIGLRSRNRQVWMCECANIELCVGDKEKATEESTSHCR